MTTYALIDGHTGDYWGAVDAPDPVAACKKLDQKIDPKTAAYRTYEVVPRLAGEPGYFVHRIDDRDAAAVEALDKEDKAVIDTIESYPHVATVRIRED